MIGAVSTTVRSGMITPGKATLTDEQLVSSALFGDTIAFEMLVDRYQNKIYRSAMGLLGNEPDAEELTQDVFVTVFNKLSQFRGESAFSTWLFRITHNLGKNMIVRRKLRQFVSLDWVMETSPDIGAIQDSTEVSEYKDQTRLILEQLQNLDYLSRHIVVLREIHDYSYDEIAEVTRLPLGTVKSRLNRAKSKLKAMLIGLQEGDLDA